MIATMLTPVSRMAPSLTGWEEPSPDPGWKLRA